MLQPVAKGGPSALIVEDEPALADEVRDLLAVLWPELQIVGHALDGVDALRQVARLEPDIVFLDIQIPDPNGLDVARMLRDRCHIVFVTAYDVHALEAFDSGAVDYILKPIDPERMALTVKRLRQRIGADPADLTGMLDRLQARRGSASHMRWITASVGSALRLIMVDDVMFFQSEQKYTRVVLADSEVLIKKTIKELVADLDPEQFWQTHRSTIVNAAEIASIEPNMAGQLSLKLRSRREQLPVAESFVRRFRQM